jgi:hypothetical protein
MSEPDPIAEIEAMRAIAQALNPLDESSRRRVLSWASDKFFSSTTARSVSAIVGPLAASEEKAAATPQPSSASSRELSSFASCAELFHACSPATDGEKALVTATWLQVIGGNQDIDSYSVNTELKHLGYGIGNITRAFQILVEARPALMIQLRKSGTSQQSRKTFRVTDAGLKRVKDMISQS